MQIQYCIISVTSALGKILRTKEASQEWFWGHWDQCSKSGTVPYKAGCLVNLIQVQLHEAGVKYTIVENIYIAFLTCHLNVTH